jgi:hypothetical protein
VARGRGLPRRRHGASPVTDAPPAPAPRRISPRVVVIGVAIYCALAWVILFKAVDFGVGLARGNGAAIHYATVDSARN